MYRSFEQQADFAREQPGMYLHKTGRNVEHIFKSPVVSSSYIKVR
jgi:hypothetical protein